MNTIMLLILWTWGLTPVWVNVIGTVLLGLGILVKSVAFVAKVCEKMETD